MKRLRSLAVLLLLMGSVSAAIPEDYRSLRRDFWPFWVEVGQTFYCDCGFDSHKRIDLPSCRYQAQDKRKAQKAQIEHIMPAQQMGQHFTCWRENPCKQSGQRMSRRQCCLNIDKRFRQAHNDMHNLVPAIGELNQARGAMRFTQFSEETKKDLGHFHQCHFYLDPLTRKVEPADEKKGWVARANLYMAKSYGIRLSQSQHSLFEAWDRLYPPSEQELAWHKTVQRMQGTQNPFIIAHQIARPPKDQP